MKPIFYFLAFMLPAASAFMPASRFVRPAMVQNAASDVEVVKKAEFLDALVEKTGLSKKDCDAVLGASLDTITEAVTAGKKVTFLGFGSFEPRSRAARTGRNPKTGEALEIKASVNPSFTASKSFKDKVNGKA